MSYVLRYDQYWVYLMLFYTDILSDSNKNNKINLKETVQIIARNARRLQRLAEDILDITKIEGRNLILNMHSFILSKIVEETVQDYTGEIRDSNRSLTLSFAISKELESTLIIADQDRIKQVISNLIDNAIFGWAVRKPTQMTKRILFYAVNINLNNLRWEPRSTQVNV